MKIALFSTCQMEAKDGGLIGYIIIASPDKCPLLTLIGHQRPPKIFLLSSRHVFKVSRLDRYNCRILITGVGVQRRESSPDRPR